MKKQSVLVVALWVAIVLISGSPAMASEDHREHDDGGDAHARMGIQAEGVLHVINQKKQKVNISHGPISALGWPPMRMDFAVKKGVDLTSLKVGQKVKFSLMKSGEYDYIVTKISPVH